MLHHDRQGALSLSLTWPSESAPLISFQAAFILQNLLVMPMPADAEEAKDSQWQVGGKAMARSKVTVFPISIWHPRRCFFFLNLAIIYFYFFLEIETNTCIKVYFSTLINTADLPIFGLCVFIIVIIINSRLLLIISIFVVLLFTHCCWFLAWSCCDHSNHNSFWFLLPTKVYINDHAGTIGGKLNL